MSDGSGAGDVFSESNCGSATITAQQEVAGIAASIDFQVEHIEEEIPAKPPTYTGKALKPEITVTLDGTELTEGADYTVTYSNNINVGTAAVKVTGKGNYASKKTASFRINKAACSVTVKAAASSVAVGKTTTVSITGAKGSESFKSSDTAVATVTSAGTVTARKVGTVQITATSAATSNYNAASKTVTIKVVPAATTTLTLVNMTTGIKLTWSNVTGATGYRIYREDTSGNKTVTIAGASNVSRVIASLTKGKTYYVRIRTYKTVDDVKYWSTWSATKSVKISK